MEAGGQEQACAGGGGVCGVAEGEGEWGRGVCGWEGASEYDGVSGGVEGEQ